MSVIFKNTFIEVTEEEEQMTPRSSGGASVRGSSLPPRLRRLEDDQELNEKVVTAKKASVAAQLQRLDSLFSAASTKTGGSTDDDGESRASPASATCGTPTEDEEEAPDRAGYESDEVGDDMWWVAGAQRQLAERMAGMYAVPVSGAAWLPSVGSQGHATRACRPCAFVRSAAGCKFGAECLFCHIAEDHHEAVRVRPCKGKRERFKRQMASIEKAVQRDPMLLASGGLTLPALAERSSRAKACVLAHLNRVAAETFEQQQQHAMGHSEVGGAA